MLPGVLLPALHRGKWSVPRTYINDVTNLSVPLFYAKHTHTHTHTLTENKKTCGTLKRDEIRKPRERRNEMKHGRNWYVCLKADSEGLHAAWQW